MACCLTAPSHYLNQSWPIISKVHWNSSEGNFAKDTSATNKKKISLKITFLKFLSNLPGANELMNMAVSKEIKHYDNCWTCATQHQFTSSSLPKLADNRNIHVSDIQITKSIQPMFFTADHDLQLADIGEQFTTFQVTSPVTMKIFGILLDWGWI